MPKFDDRKETAPEGTLNDVDDPPVHGHVSIRPQLRINEEVVQRSRPCCATNRAAN